jgi:hypothetical protein
MTTDRYGSIPPSVNLKQEFHFLIPPPPEVQVLATLSSTQVACHREDIVHVEKTRDVCIQDFLMKGDVKKMN